MNGQRRRQGQANRQGQGRQPGQNRWQDQNRRQGGQGENRRPGMGSGFDPMDGMGRAEGRQPGGNGMGPGSGMNRQARGAPRQSSPDSLQKRQGQLLDDLNGLIDKLGRLGAKTPEDLMRAGSKMGQAESALGRKSLGSASQRQGQALDSLRKGARQLAEQIMKQRMGRGRNSGGRDPLGRRRRGGPEFGENVKVPDEIDTRRARDILEELRRRLGQSTRPPAELDYLERLIEQF
jgi:hypothetical protein